LRALDLAGDEGALCGRFLADLGADVVKVEPPGRPDRPGSHPGRTTGPCLGQHAQQVLKELLGYPDGELAELAAEGVLE